MKSFQTKSDEKCWSTNAKFKTYHYKATVNIQKEIEKLIKETAQRAQKQTHSQLIVVKEQRQYSAIINGNRFARVHQDAFLTQL